MTMSETDARNDDGLDSRYEGYSNYRAVSSSIAKSVDDALEAYSQLQSLHVENARVSPRQAAEARAKILSAALRLVPELREDAPGKETYKEILARWQGDITIDGDKVPPNDDSVEDGYIDDINDVQLHQECPTWLYRFVIDIRTAGWELGYLHAGRTVTEDNLEPAEQQAREMFE